MEKKLKELSEIELFSGLSRDELTTVSGYCLPRSFRKGEVLFYEGEEADCLYVIIEGEVEVWSHFREKERDLLALQKEKCIVGEMALIDKLPRSATLIAGTSVRTYYIDCDGYEEILKNCPSIAVILMKSLSLIVRNSNQSYMATLSEQNKKIEDTYKKLIQTQEQLHREEKLATLGQFSSMILHDIRNPLTAIMSYSELSMKKYHGQLDEGLLRAFNSIMGETKKLNRLASDLLDFTRGGMGLNYSLIELEPFLKGIIKEQSPALMAKEIQIVLDLDFKGVLLIDGERFERVMLNLINNARKALLRGGFIEIKAREENRLFRMEIHDNGRGMPRETVEHIFEPFYTNSGPGGTGLGMVIVKNIIELHDGSIQVDSVEGEGTTVTLKIPMKH